MPKSVLVIDAIATHRIRFAALLDSAHYTVTTAATTGELKGDLKAYDLVLLGLPEDQPGSEIAVLSKMLGQSSLPILCLDAKRSPLRA